MVSRDLKRTKTSKNQLIPLGELSEDAVTWNRTRVSAATTQCTATILSRRDICRASPATTFELLYTFFGSER